MYRVFLKMLKLLRSAGRDEGIFSSGCLSGSSRFRYSTLWHYNKAKKKSSSNNNVFFFISKHIIEKNLQNFTIEKTVQ